MESKPKLTPEDEREFKRLIYEAIHCPVCGEPMIHYRLRGYKCYNERHNEMVAAGYRPPVPPAPDAGA